MRAPFPWFGSKAKIAARVWEAFGPGIHNYVEPFAASLAVLLNRPDEPGVETVNDLDALLVNFWRAVRAEPDRVAELLAYPVSEVDMNARHRWLVDTARSSLRTRAEEDPDFYDTKAAAWWVWGLCQWIGPLWCEHAYKEKRTAAEGTRYASRSKGNWGKFPSRLPALGNPGMGVHAPTFGDPGEVLEVLSLRLRRVRITCGDWRRVLTPAVTTFHGVTAVFLDPPYGEGEGDYAVPSDPDLWDNVSAWAAENGENLRLRIALCGYEGMRAPAGWQKLAWVSDGGYGARGGEGGQGRRNAGRERIWFSPHCTMGGTQRALFDR